MSKVILIHGLNNNTEGFGPLKSAMETQGFTCEVLCLPGHNGDREECRDLETASHHFDESINKLVEEPYAVIAFSQGALYLQLWLEQNSLPKPYAQVLLAPALFVKNQGRLETFFSILPQFISILSRTPKQVRKYISLYVWEYRSLFQAVRKYQSMRTPLRVPTLVMMDPKDEVIDGKLLDDKLRERNPLGFEMFWMERPYIKSFGRHHVFFHPDFFSQKDWKKLTQEITTFLKGKK